MRLNDINDSNNPSNAGDNEIHCACIHFVFTYDYSDMVGSL